MNLSTTSDDFNNGFVISSDASNCILNTEEYPFDVSNNQNRLDAKIHVIIE